MADIVINPAIGKIDFFTTKGESVTNTLRLTGNTLLVTGPLSASSISTGGGGAFVTSVQPTTNYLSKFTGNSTIANSVIYDNGTNVGIGSTSPTFKLDVNGSIALSGYRFADFNTYYNRIFEPAGNTAIYLGNASDPTNYSDNTNHAFRNRGGSSVYAYINSNGNLGIGTTSPGAPLTIYRASNPWIRVNGGGAFSYIQLDDGTSYGYLLKNSSSDTSNNALAGALYTYTDSGKAFQHIHSGTALFTILSGGSIGIGSTAPSYKLEVYSGAKTSAFTGLSISNFNNYDGTAASLVTSQLRFAILENPTGTYNAPARTFTILESGNEANNSSSDGFFAISTRSGGTVAEKLRLNSAGNLGIGTTNPTTKLAISDGTTIAQVNPSSGVAYFGSLNNYPVALSVNSSEKVRIISDGNVGIGSTAPAYKLEVIGDVRVSGGLVNAGLSAQWTLSGGGTATYNGSSILWNARVIAIPVERTEFGADGYIDITCPTSGTITYYNGSNVTTTVTCNANGIPIANWESLYYEVTPGQSAASDQTKFRLVNYNNTTWRPSSNWLLICTRNGDGNAIKWLPGQIVIPNGGAFDSSNSTNNWEISGTTNYIARFTSANKIGNSSVLYDNGANIGIGTTSPAYKLDVSGNARFTSDTFVNGNLMVSKAGANLYINGSNSDAEIHWQANGTSRWAMGMNVGDATENLNIYNYTTSTTNFTILKASGNVGIGSSSPVYKLDVNGIIASSGVAIAWFSGNYNRLYEPAGNPALYLGNNTDPANYYDNTTHYFRNRGGSTNYAIINSSGNLGVGTTVASYKVDVVGAVRATIDNDFSFVLKRSATNVWTGLGYYTANNSKWFVGLRETGDDNLRWYNYTNSAERMVLTEAGSLGVGTTSPGTKLDVVGEITTPVIKQSATLYSGTDITDDNSTRTVYFNIPLGGYSPPKYFKVARIKITGNYQNVSLNGYFTTTNSTGLHVGSERKVEFDFIAYAATNPGAPTVTYLKRGPDTTNVLVYAVPNGGGAGTTYYDVYIRSAWYNDTNGELAVRVGYSSAVTIWQAGLDSGTSAPTDTLVNPNSSYSFDTSGNIGIGTTSPAYKLDVVSGSIRASSGAYAGELYFGTNSNADLYLKRDNNYDLSLVQNAASGNGLYLASAGNVYLSIDSNNNETTSAFIVQNNAIKAGTELFRVNEAGSVGIGTSSPGYKLDVGAVGSNSVSVRLTPGYERVRYYGFDLLGYNDGNLWMIGNNATNALILGSNWDWDSQIAIAYTPGTFGAGGGTLELGQVTKNNANFTHGNTRFYTNGIERLRIISSGNVGVGTTSPTAKFQVGTHSTGDAGNGDNSANVRIGAASAGARVFGMTLANTAAATLSNESALSFVLAGNYSATGIISALLRSTGNAATDLIFTNYNGSLQERMRILYDGNVGIGTSAPAYKLDISGTGFASSDFRAPIFYDSANTAYYVDPASTSNLNILSVTGYQYINGQTLNGQSFYQWEGATYRNPGDHTPQLLIRKDNSTTGINGFAPALALYNNNGADQTTVGMTFVSAEAVSPTQGNSVELAGIIAKKESTGTAGGWSRGSLNFYTKDFGTRKDVMYMSPDGTVTVTGTDNNSGKADFSVDTGGTATMALSGQYFRVGSTDVNWAIKIQNDGYIATWAQQMRFSTDSGDNAITFATNGTNRVNIGGSTTETVKITGYANYVGNYGYNTLTLIDTSGYPGLNYRSGNNNWLMRMDGGGTYSMNWSSNASAKDVGTFSTPFYFGTTGTAYASNDFRAPIFYDANDTSYYVDPNSASVLNGLRLVSSGNQVSGGDYSLWIQGGNEDWGIGIIKSSANYGITYNLAASHTYAIQGNKNGTEYFRLGTDMLYHDTRVQAPIFYDSADTAYYLDPASTTTSLQIAGAIEQGNDLARPLVQWGVGGDTTGMIIIKLPGTSSNYGMIHAVIDIYEYSSNNVSTIIVGGHNWNGAWYNIGANVVGYTNKTVRLGFKDGQYCIVLGGASSVWSYGQVVLRKIQNGAYYTNNMNLGGTYSISQTATESFTYVSGDLTQLRTPGTFIAYGDIRAPIFYDSDNTNYYVNPASTSQLNVLGLAGYIDVGTYIYLRDNLRMLNSGANGWLETIVRNSGNPYFQNGIDGGTFLASDTSENNNWLFQEAARGWGIFYFNRGTQSGQTFGNYTTVGAETFIIGQGTGTTMPSGWTGYNASSKVAIMLSNYSGYIWANDTIYSATGMRAPIFYDSNDTSYYCDPASTSRLNTINVGASGVIINNGSTAPERNLKIKASGSGTSSVGIVLYDSSDTFRCQLYSEPSNYGFLNGLWASWDIKKTIGGNLYLNDSTTYYLNTTSTSALYDLTLIGSKNTYLYINPGNGYEAMVRYNGGSGNSWYVGKRVTSQVVGTESFHFYSEAAGATVAGIDTSGNIFSIASVRAPIFYDSNDTGYYLNPAGSSQLSSVYANDWFRAQGNTGLYFQDKGYGITSAGAASNSYGNASTYGSGVNGWQGWGIGSRHCMMSTGGDNFGVHDNTRGSWLYYWDGTYHRFQYGYLQSANSVRAPIFYDSDDTGYYLDPNGGSVLKNVNLNLLQPRSGVTHSDIYAQDAIINSYYHGDALTYDVFQFNAASLYEIKLTSTHSFSSTTVETSIFKGDRFGGMTIANNTYQVRWTWSNTIGYKFFKSLYIGNSTNGNSFAVTIEYSGNGSTWTTLATSDQMSNWPGHSWYNYAWNNNAAQGYIRLTITPVWSTAYDINIYNMRYFASYNLDASVRLYDWDYSRNVTFPNSVTTNYGTFASPGIILGDAQYGFYVSAGNVYYKSASGGAHYWRNTANSGNNMSLDNSGILSVGGSVRAPIFYDSDNTAYYVDPASASNVNNLTTAGTLYTNNIAKNANGSPIVINSGLNASLGLRVYYDMNLYNTLTFTDSSWNSQGAIFGSGGNVTINAATATTSFIKYAGYSQEGGSFRAPIFYDSDDTTYYLDPASTSLSLKTRSSIIINNASSPQNLAMLNIGYNGAGETRAIDIYGGWSGGENKSISFTHGSTAADIVAQINGQHNGPGSKLRFGKLYHGGNSSTYTMELISESTTSAYLTVVGSVRSPIFYDSDNTAYYLDPNSTSNLVGLTVANTITGNIATATNLITTRSNWSTNGTITAVVGQLCWKNYGNGHTIIDASNSTSPAGGAIGNTNPDYPWTGTYPTLMGWNGANTYGVRVDSARYSDQATTTVVNSGNTSAAWYPVVWHSGNTLYSSTGVQIYANGSYLQAAYLNSSDNVDTGNITYIMAKFGDNYLRSATAAKVATFISGQTMNINGSSTSCSGNAATCTTANAVAAGAVKAAGLDNSVSFTMAGLTSNGTINIFPTYATGYSYFLRMGYDNSGNYDYTIKRNGTTGFLEFNGTQTNYVSYYFVLNGTGGLGIGVSPSSRLHVNGDGTNPAIRIDNGAINTSVTSNGRTFYGWLPISIAGTTRWIQLYT